MLRYFIDGEIRNACIAACLKSRGKKFMSCKCWNVRFTLRFNPEACRAEIPRKILNLSFMKCIQTNIKYIQFRIKVK